MGQEKPKSFKLEIEISYTAYEQWILKRQIGQSSFKANVLINCSRRETHRQPFLGFLQVNTVPRVSESIMDALNSVGPPEPQV